MKTYSNIITLEKNLRGVWSLDTIKGCKYGAKMNPNGCYDSCYAARMIKRSGIDFSKSVKRNFKSEWHLYKILRQLKNIDMPFVRIGTNGDPSEDWEHTIRVCGRITKYSFFGKLIGYDFFKPIVIVTKHWKIIPDKLLKKLKNICINTSISALDSDTQIKHRLKQYNRLKQYCNSVLRVNTCDFNIDNIEGEVLNKIQLELLDNDKVLDTILRFSKNHELAQAKIINLDYTKFLSSNTYASVYNKNTYFGMCDNCPDMCGINL